MKKTTTAKGRDVWIAPAVADNLFGLVFVSQLTEIDFAEVYSSLPTTLQAVIDEHSLTLELTKDKPCLFVIDGKDENELLEYIDSKMDSGINSGLNLRFRRKFTFPESRD